jgi:putative ATP-binding cassette transporter
MPAGAKLLVLPQRAYVPSGTLRRAANYPEAADSRSVEEIANVLKKVGLGHLIEHLDEERPWDQILSGGEKQRLAFARVFLRRPDIILLDEATAALDSQSEDRLMELLSREFKQATVVSVGHRSELEALHGRKIVLQRRLSQSEAHLAEGTAEHGTLVALEFQPRASNVQTGRAGLKDVNNRSGLE